MYTKEMIKDLFKSLGIRVEIETHSLYQNCFVIKTNNGNKVYFWDNKIVSRNVFENNLINAYNEKNKKTID